MLGSHVAMLGSLVAMLVSHVAMLGSLVAMLVSHVFRCVCETGGLMVGPESI